MQTEGVHQADIEDHIISSDLVSPITVQGKFFFAAEQKFYVRGVTYGTFGVGADGAEYACEDVERDFGMMATQGINAVRVYTVPPRWLLDAALKHGLRVMIGLPWEQHVTFLADRRRMYSVEQRVRAGVRDCAGHPAVLCYAVGNEIPSSIVRWHGARQVERFLRRLCRAVKEEDAGALVTYVNFPSTEYLELEFVDIVCFNVYLESRDRLERYLARLQNLAGDRPLMIAEIGLDSQRNGEEGQAAVLTWQLRSAFASGSAGMFVFAWTDEWHRGGQEIMDWDFGLVTRDRQPKQALADVRNAFSEVPFPTNTPWPTITVVVCSYNGASTIKDCLEGLTRLEYPAFEVIVVDDGSTDETATIVSEYNVRLIQTENQGLSAARNVGLHAASGEIVAYTDDDARPDPHWLHYMAAIFLRTAHAAVGGPNIAPSGDGPIAACIANAPGGPVHVLLTDEIAEHIPGCNMAIRVKCLKEIGGFDPLFRAAEDDVDVCWRLQEHGWSVGFSPGAMVWHHRRNSVRAYWKQQQGYGKAEALLEKKWPERYNTIGHLSWAGRLYGAGLPQALHVQGARIYHGTWGSALFQSVYDPVPGVLSSLPLMPEWWLIVGALGGLAFLGFAWAPMLLAWPFFPLGAMVPVAQAIVTAIRVPFASRPTTGWGLPRLRLLTAVLYLLQPLARLRGRIRSGLTPWRRRGWHGLRFPRPMIVSVWSEHWHAPEDWLYQTEARLRKGGIVVHRGGAFDRWDLEVRGGILGSGRVLMALEEHGQGKQLCRFRIRPYVPPFTLFISAFFTVLCFSALLNSAHIAAVVLGLVALIVIVGTGLQCAVATASAASAPTDTWVEDPLLRGFAGISSEGVAL